MSCALRVLRVGDACGDGVDTDIARALGAGDGVCIDTARALGAGDTCGDGVDTARALGAGDGVGTGTASCEL